MSVVFLSGNLTLLPLVDYKNEFTISVSISAPNMKSFLSSLFSTTKKPSHKKQLHSQAAPASDDSGHAPQVKSPNQPQHETVNGELGHVDLKQLQVDGDIQIQAAQASGDSDNTPQVNSPKQPQHETVNRELGHVDLNDQPPSVKDVRPVVVSQPSGGGSQMSMGPSLNDVGRREASKTEASLTGERPMVDEQELAGMSLVGNRFRDVLVVTDGIPQGE